MANDIIINGNKYEPYFEGQKLKEAWLNGVKIWSSGNDGVGVALMGDSTANLYNIFVTYDGWDTAVMIMSNVTVGGGTAPSCRIRRHDGRIFIQTTSGDTVKSEIHYIYELDVDSKTLTVVNSEYQTGGTLELLEVHEGVIPIVIHEKKLYSYNIDTNRYENGTVTYAGIISCIRGKYFFSQYESYAGVHGSYDKEKSGFLIEGRIGVTMPDKFYRSQSFAYVGSRLIGHEGNTYHLNSSSDDGKSFSLIHQNSETAYIQSIRSVAQGNGTWVVTFNPSTKIRVFYSTDDGVTFNVLPFSISYNDNATVSAYIGFVRFDGERFVINDYNYIYTSEDGITWVTRASSSLFNGTYSRVQMG